MSHGKVYYWGKLGSNVGHLSLTLEDGTYISHWPNENKGDGSSAGIRKIPAAQQPSLKVDCELEGRQPDETVAFPEGLVDYGKVIAWWNEYKKTSSYNLLYSNCAQTVRLALCNGGIKQPTHHRHGIATRGVTPYDILYWIKECIEYHQSYAPNPIHTWVKNLF